MILSICTLPMSPAKNSSSVTAALISLRAGRRSNSLDNLRAMRGKWGHKISTCALWQVHQWCHHKSVLLNIEQFCTSVNELAQCSTEVKPTDL